MDSSHSRVPWATAGGHGRGFPRGFLALEFVSTSGIGSRKESPPGRLGALHPPADILSKSRRGPSVLVRTASGGAFARVGDRSFGWFFLQAPTHLPGSRWPGLCGTVGGMDAAAEPTRAKRCACEALLRAPLSARRLCRRAGPAQRGFTACPAQAGPSASPADVSAHEACIRDVPQRPGHRLSPHGFALGMYSRRAPKGSRKKPK